MELRGADLRRIREDALEKLNRHNIATNLVVTLKKGLNDHEIGKTIDYALQQPCVRGVTFQPIQDAGRLESWVPDHIGKDGVEKDRVGTDAFFRPAEQSEAFHNSEATAPLSRSLRQGGDFDVLSVPANPNAIGNPGKFVRNFNPATDRLTLTEVRRKILEQTNVFRPEDIIPVPCHPDSLAMAYALKMNGKVTPLTGMIPPEVLISGAANTILYEQEPAIRDNLFKLFATNHSPASSAGTLRELLCCLPKVLVPDSVTYENIFRIIIMQFIDAHSFDVRSVKKTCVHIVHPDGRLIPFDTYNLFYRDDLEQTRLNPLRRRPEAALAAT
jgi:hypothetical protein